MERKQYHFTDDQRAYISDFLFSRQEYLANKVTLYRQKRRIKKALEEMSLLHEIIHELYENDFRPTD